MSTELLERTWIGRAWDPKVAVGSVLILVFLCGVFAGAAMESRWHYVLHKPAFDTSAGKSLYFDQLQRELNLSPSQAEEMRSILGDMWQYYRSVLSYSRDRVEQILTPQQREKFERMLQQQK
ncbi:MAG: hypothetical protein JO323_02165 [Acidobacteriia bacterium]|nr:hypothetical protein [Terriglobia bacterium]